MNKFKKTILTGAATAALLVNSVLPAFAATTITISGNGSNSENDAQVEIKRETTVVQENKADIENKVNVDANTGNNQANDNTGGDVEIETGDADVNVKVENSANSNVAELNGCDCPTDAEVKISGNGTKSENDVDLELKNKTQIYQENKAYIENKIDVDAETGYNEAEDNTGGNVKIKTGDSDVKVDLSTLANSNVALQGGHGNGGGSVSAMILDNGSYSENDIDLEFKKETLLDQFNYADIENDVDVDGSTGNNDADDNTGGEVAIETGDSDVKVYVDNMSNFNAADLDCGCVLDVVAKIAGNGTDSENEIEAEFKDELATFQENKDKTENDVDVDSETGKNDADDNTQGSDEDPSIVTGDSDATVELSNQSNVNQLGDFDWGDWTGHDVNVTFDLGALLAFLGL